MVGKVHGPQGSKLQPPAAIAKCSPPFSPRPIVYKIIWMDTRGDFQIKKLPDKKRVVVWSTGNPLSATQAPIWRPNQILSNVLPTALSRRPAFRHCLINEMTLH